MSIETPGPVSHCNLFACGSLSFLLSLPSALPISAPLNPPPQPQLGNLLQVNRTLGRNVPLTSQLILMPNGAVAAVQQEAPPAHSPGVHTDTDQVSDALFWGSHDQPGLAQSWVCTCSSNFVESINSVLLGVNGSIHLVAACFGKSPFIP